MSISRDDAKKRIAELIAALQDLDGKRASLQHELNELSNGLADATERRARACGRGAYDGAAFTTNELTFAAYARCDCGAGLAYPNDMGIHGWWDCSAILTGAADSAVKHSGELPFAFYEIKSEGQPSANGATTRSACNGQHDAPPCGPICFAVTVAD